MKKWMFSVIFPLFLLLGTLSPARAAVYTPEKINAMSALLINTDNGAIVTEKNIDLRMAPASITKIVTAILTIENCPDLEKKIKVPEEAIRALDGTNSSTADLKPGEELTVRQLLFCLMVYSANDAANVLAVEIGGDTETFVGMMNAFVSSLGCASTHFLNPHGLDARGHYTTARDLATIYSYCMKNSLFAEIAGTAEYQMPATEFHEARVLRNTNSMFNAGIQDYYYQYARSGKTGTTDNAGRCLISTAARDGYNYLCVILGAKMMDCDDDGVDENMAYIESKRLYEWAFENLRLREVADPNVTAGELPVRLAQGTEKVRFAPGESVSALVPVGVNAQSVLIEPILTETPAYLTAPVAAGDVIGRANILYAGESIGVVSLVAAEEAQRSWPKYLGDLALRFVREPLFQFGLVLVVCVLLPLLLVFFVFFPRRRRRRRANVKMVNVKEVMRGEQSGRPEEPAPAVRKPRPRPVPPPRPVPQEEQDVQEAPEPPEPPEDRAADAADAVAPPPEQKKYAVSVFTLHEAPSAAAPEKPRGDIPLTGRAPVRETPARETKGQSGKAADDAARTDEEGKR